MPIYEYQCAGCHRRSSHLIRRLDPPEPVACPHCAGRDLRRIMSRFAAPRSEESRLETLADPGRWGGLDENDPSSVARFVRQMGSEMGEEISRDEIEQMADEAAQESDAAVPGDGATSAGDV